MRLLTDHKVDLAQERRNRSLHFHTVEQRHRSRLNNRKIVPRLTWGLNLKPIDQKSISSKKYLFGNFGLFLK